jgi:hypothetical protein
VALWIATRPLMPFLKQKGDSGISTGVATDRVTEAGRIVGNVEVRMRPSVGSEQPVIRAQSRETT